MAGGAGGAGEKRLAAPLAVSGVTARVFRALEIIQEEDARVQSDIETVCDDADVSQIICGGALRSRTLLHFSK
jgi:hypothetical protein